MNNVLAVVTRFLPTYHKGSINNRHQLLEPENEFYYLYLKLTSSESIERLPRYAKYILAISYTCLFLVPDISTFITMSEEYMLTQMEWIYFSSFFFFFKNSNIHGSCRYIKCCHLFCHGMVLLCTLWYDITLILSSNRVIPHPLGVGTSRWT